MSPELYQRVRKLLEEALDRPEAERLSFLEAACGRDENALREVRQLLKAHGDLDGFLEEETGRPQRIGRYLITGELGRGAMGIVYEATDPLIGRQIAIKIIHLQSFAEAKDAMFLRERLFREARSAGVLSHPGIVVVFDVGEERDMAFIAMERLDGPSLFQMLESGRKIEWTEALDILRQTAVALDYAHQSGIVHRDIKPANIMLHKGAIVKVTDFGIAKITAARGYTQTGLLMGTPSYMSPEQIQVRPLDGRSDQFSLAVVAYELLTGTLPFEADSVAPLAHMIAYADRPSAHAANPALPEAVDEVLYRGLAKLPNGRYASCAEFVAALEKAITEVPPAAPPPTFAAKCRKRTLLGYLASAASVALTLALAVLGYKLVSPSPKPVVSPDQISFAPILPPPDPNRPPPVPQPLFSDAHRLESLLRAANRGDTRAMVVVGEIYMEDSPVVSKDYPQALLWFRKAADAGNPSGMLFLGAMCYLGNGIPEDWGLAASWYRKAADLGNPDAMYDLGRMYENGRGVGKDLKQATALYRRAAQLGNTEAEAGLARLAAYP